MKERETLWIIGITGLISGVLLGQYGHIWYYNIPAVAFVMSLFYISYKDELHLLRKKKPTIIGQKVKGRFE